MLNFLKKKPNDDFDIIIIASSIVDFKNELELNYFIATKLDKKAEGIAPEKKEIVENDQEEDKSLMDKISRLNYVLVAKININYVYAIAIVVASSLW